MLLKVKLGNTINIKNLVSAVTGIACDADLQCGSFVVDAKSILGVLSLPTKDTGILKVDSDDPAVCTPLLEKLEALGVLCKEGPMIQKTTFLACALGEMLIDFTMQGRNEQGQRIFAQNAGGAPANVMAAMAKLGARTAFIGKAGDDMHGRFLKETLDGSGIDSTGFTLTKDYFTTLAFVDIKEDGDREFSFARNHGADKMLEKGEIPLNIIRSCGILHIGSVSLTDEPVRSTTLFAVQKAKEAGCVISYDPNYRAPLWKDEETAKRQMRSMIKYTDLIKISEEETELMTDESGYEKAAEALLSQGVKIAVVTLGKLGAYVRTADGGRIVKGFKNKAVDATGAGDSFWGGFLYQFSRLSKIPENITVSEAAGFADFGNAVASVCVEHYGAIPAMPTMEQVTEKMKEERQA